MWDLVGNPEDRFSHNEAHIAYKVGNDQTAPVGAKGQGKRLLLCTDYFYFHMK